MEALVSWGCAIIESSFEYCSRSHCSFEVGYCPGSADANSAAAAANPAYFDLYYDDFDLAS